MFEIDKMPSSIDIGYTGETCFRDIKIDMSAWMEKMPTGVPSIIHIRPWETKEDAYIAATTFADNILTWVITDADLGTQEGEGEMQIWLEEEENDSIIKRGKSIKVTTKVIEAADDPAEDPPAPQQGWITQMTALKDATVEAAEAAEDAQEAAEDAQAAAEDARDAAQAAAGDFQGLTASVEGLAAGADPTIEVTHSQGGLYHMAFGIPKGDKGDTGYPTDAQVATAISAVVTNPDSPPLDRTLSSNVSAAPADMVGDLKSAVDDIFIDNKTSTSDITVFDQGYVINPNTGVVSSAGANTYYASTRKPFVVSAGERYTISCLMRYSNAVVAFYDNSDVFISSIPGTAGVVDGNNRVFTNYPFTVPANAVKMLIGTYTSTYTLTKIENVLSAHPTWIGKKWACIGDSLTAENTATTKHYYDYVAENTGIIPVNLGVNGTGYARSSGSGDAFYNRINDVPTDADVVTIFGSFNDIGSGLDFGDVDDTGTTTIAGCINTTITNLQAQIPLVNLGIVAPTPWDTTRPNFVPTSNSYQYVNMLKMICERRSIPFLNLWYCSNLRPWDADFRAVAYSKDGGSGTHPDENGHKLIASRFEWFLSSLLL